MKKLDHNIKGDLTKGKHCFIVTKGEVLAQLKKELDRKNENLCLKVFYDQDKPGNWGDDKHPDKAKRNTTIKEAAQIQNICWYHGLAPRVYQVLQIDWNGKVCDAQITDLLDLEKLGTDAEAEKMYEKIEKLGEGYGWTSNYREWKARDLLEGKFIDFQTFNLTSDYKKKLTAKYKEYGTYGKKYYHNVPELDLNGGPRKNDQRVKWLGLDKIDFKGKTYVDLGCANGFFTRYADEKGAKKVVGVDTKNDAMKDPLLSAWLVSNLTGYYNINYFEVDLSKPVIMVLKKTDIATFLSMTHHVGVPVWLNKIANLIIVEDNGKDRSDYGENYKKLEKLFSKVELKGHSSDRSDSLPIYYCYK